MSYRLESLQTIIYNAKRCFVTLPDGERVYFNFRKGQCKDFMAGGGMGHQPHVYLLTEKGEAKGWYPVRALKFEMPDGEIVR